MQAACTIKCSCTMGSFSFPVHLFYGILTISARSSFPGQLQVYPPGLKHVRVMDVLSRHKFSEVSWTFTELDFTSTKIKTTSRKTKGHNRTSWKIMSLIQRWEGQLTEYPLNQLIYTSVILLKEKKILLTATWAQSARRSPGISQSRHEVHNHNPSHYWGMAPLICPHLQVGVTQGKTYFKSNQPESQVFKTNLNL